MQPWDLHLDYSHKPPHVLGPDLSQGRTCLRAGLVLTFLRARLVFTCLRAGLVSGPDLSRAPGPEMSRAGSVSRPLVSKCLGPEMSRGLSLFAAGIVLELKFLQLIFSPSDSL